MIETSLQYETKAMHFMIQYLLSGYVLQITLRKNIFLAKGCVYTYIYIYLETNPKVSNIPTFESPTALPSLHRLRGILNVVDGRLHAACWMIVGG